MLEWQKSSVQDPYIKSIHFPFPVCSTGKSEFPPPNLRGVLLFGFITIHFQCAGERTKLTAAQCKSANASPSPRQNTSGYLSFLSFSQIFTLFILKIETPIACVYVRKSELKISQD